MVNVPLGTTLSQVAWLSTPDKYEGPRQFATLSKAQASGARVTAELDLTAPNGSSISVSGGIPSSDPGVRGSAWQDPGVLPKEGAHLTTIDTDTNELVFTNRDGGRWVLIPS